MMSSIRSLWQARTTRVRGAARRRWSPAVEGLEARAVLAFTPSLPFGFPLATFTPRLAQLAAIPTTLTLSGPITPVTVGQTFQFQAVVGGSGGTFSPSGTVTFYVDGVARTQAQVMYPGVATTTLPALTAGNHVVTASYSGDFQYAPSSGGPTTQVINKAATAAALTASTTTPTSNQTVFLTVRLSAPGANTAPPGFTGQVSLYDNSNLIATMPVGAGGVTSFSRTFATGGHTVVASYNGDGNFLASQSNPVSLQVFPGAGLGAGQAAPAATVVSVSRFGFHAQPTVLQVAFSSPMDATRAQNPANYVIVGPGGNVIPVLAAAYNPATQSATLLPARQLNLHYGYVLAVIGSGPNGLTDATGEPLAGMGGVPGTNYVTLLTAANLVIPGFSPLATALFLANFGLI